ncbi:Oxidoreductase ptaJ [Fusarium oxysporum f. sp. cubense]|uniref:Oxidoreductase ptaJ n=1 Tax=Fusarium oxysporum f. sp. cubense TaxID=61366 RepID=A0A559LLL4_FUSOC|nr:Oxidoreductase ptaJ [Fusarium oxysporum f. sp. cubense]
MTATLTATDTRASTVRLDPAATQGIWHASAISIKAGEIASKVLQENHNKHHIFFSYMDREGVHMHNHIVHHILTLFALGATPAEIQKLYDVNLDYQRDAVPEQKEMIRNLSNPAVYKKAQGDEDNYMSFMKFYEDEIAAKGVPAVVEEYVFAEDHRADDMLVRLFMGFLHPIIHLGCGLEFDQPAVVAEALAQAAVHSDNFLFTFFHEAESRAEIPGTGKKNLAELLDLARASEKCRNASNSQVREKIRDGVLLNAKEEAMQLATQYKVEEDEVDLRTAELCNATAYIVAGAQRPNKAPRMDFFLMHPMNMAIFFGTFAKLPWLSQAAKARLLTYAGRFTLILYIDMGAPKLDLDIIRNYTPQRADGTWPDAIRRGILHPDDGHASKMIRAVLYAEQVSKTYEDRPEFRMNGADFEKFAVVGRIDGSPSTSGLRFKIKVKV